MKKFLLSLLVLCSMTAAWAEGTGDGTKERPYSGEWSIPELYNRVQEGDHIALDCDVKRDGDGYITIYDVKLDKHPVVLWDAWSPGNLISAATLEGDYAQYGKDNPHDKRIGQTFIVTGKCPDDHNPDITGYMIKGYFSGFYTTTDALGWVYVESAEQMKIILGGNSNVTANTSAKIKLTQDIYLSDIANGTFCDTFSGTLDGDGHTIYGSHDGTRQNRTYLFTHSSGATFKNLNFKNIRVDNRDNGNQSVITTDAKNECVFDNITFENISTYTSINNTGAVAGHATTNCSFNNITVKNSDFTVNEDCSGTVVGLAENCTFTNIKVEHCESTARDNASSYSSTGFSGGVVGQSKDCSFENVEVHDSFIKTLGQDAGGIVGYSVRSNFSNCTIDDQSCVYAQFAYNRTVAEVGGIVGSTNGGSISGCINSALICFYRQRAGGIVGNNEAYELQIDNCLNTGMIVSIDNIDDLTGDNGYYTKYKNKTLPCVTKYYNGKEYSVRQTDKSSTGGSYLHIGGILGDVIGSSCTIRSCANIGSMGKYNSTGGIVGFCNGNATLSDCLSAFEFPSNINGFIGGYGDYSENTFNISNCINTATESDYPNNSAATFVVNKVFSRTRNNLTDVNLASGEICYALGANWEQNLGTDAYPTPTGTKGLYHTRTVNSTYGTVCLPFAVESNDNVKFYSFKEVDNSGDAVNFRFTPIDVVEAGQPALFSVEVEIPGEIAFESIGGAVTFTPNSSQNGDWEFVGTFVETKFTDEAELLTKYYISNNRIRNASQSLTMHPFRAYFDGVDFNQLTSNGAQSRTMIFSIGDGDGETTGLELVGDDLVPMQQSGKSYSLMGTEVGNGYRGLIIKNGKKMIQNR